MKISNKEVARPVTHVPAVDKAFSILETLKSGGREYTLIELAEATGLNKSTVHKLLVTLSYHGAVERDDLTKRFRLGTVLIEYASVVLSDLDVRRPAKPYLKSLVEFSGESAFLAVLRGTKLVIADKEEPPIAIRVSPPLGWHYPATLSALGKCLMAWQPEDRVEAILLREGLPARTTRSITDPIAYKAELAEIRRRGYSADVEEFYVGVQGVGAPVFGFNGRIVAVLGIGCMVFRVSDEMLNRFGEKCVEYAQEISKKL